MDIKVTVSAQDGIFAKPLKISISGSHIRLSGSTCGKEVTIEEENGDITIGVFTNGHTQQPTAERCPMVEQPPVLEEAPHEEVPAAEQPIESEALPQVETHVVSVAQAVAVEQPTAVEKPVEVSQPVPPLFEQLAALRRKISIEDKLPPYIIFHDSTLNAMCRVLPLDLQALKDVHGVGEKKVEKYGQRFIEVIRQYTAAAV